MNYIAFTKDLYMSSFERELSFRTRPRMRKKPVEEVADNYDRHYQFGLCMNDDVHARDHAFQVIRRLEDKTLSIQEREKLKGQLCQDFKNYIECMDNLLTGCDGPARKIIEVMAGLDCERELIDRVNVHYSKYIDRTEEHRELWETSDYYPAYPDLYIKMGDRALFLKKDVTLAMQCYALADLDWYGIRDEEYCDIAQKTPAELTDRYQELMEWHELYIYYQRIISGKVMPDELQADKTLTSAMSRAFENTFIIRENEACYKEIWGDVTEYFEALEEKMHSVQPDISELRSAFIIAHYLRDKALLSGIMCLKMEDKSVQKRLMKDVWDCFLHSSESKIQPIREYLSGKECSKELWEQVLLFVDALYAIYMIQSYLLVDDVPDNMAYYTALNTFFYMLPAKVDPGEKCGRLSVMNIAYMNDPNEGKMLKKFLFGSSDSYAGAERQSVKYPYVFMKCFTSRIDDLPMWEMYGNHAKGCCLVLDWEKMRTQMDGKKDVPLYRVCYLSKGDYGYQAYRKDNKNIADLAYFNKCLKRLAHIAKKLRKYPDSLECFMSLLEDILYLFKDGSYSYEEELRIYYSYPVTSDAFRHTGGEYPKLFVQPEFDIHLKEIIIGPKFEGLADKMPYIQEQVDMMCKETKAKTPRITMSGIEYR